MSPQMYWQTDDETVSSSYTSTMQMRTYSKGQNGVPVDMVGFSNTNPNYYNSGRQKMVVLTDYLTISPDTQYSVNFAHTLNFNARYTIDVYVVAYGNGVKRIPIFSETYTGGNWSAPNYSDFSFKINSADLGTSYKCRLYIEHSILSQYGYGSDGSDVYQLIQREIGIVDDDVGWLVKILNAIRAIPSKISGFFSSLGEHIGGFFTDLKENIKQKFDDLKQWFNDLGDRISGFFDDLKLKIETTFQSAVDEIKSWFIPSEGFMEKYNNKWLNWCEEHFGVLVQFPEILVDLVHRLSDVMSPNSYMFTFPEISVPIAGRTYVFVEEQTVDMSFWLNGQTTTKYLYDVYTVCVYAIFIFALFKYIQHIDEKIMLKG